MAATITDILNSIRGNAATGAVMLINPEDVTTLARHLGLVADPTRCADGRPRYSLTTRLDGPSGPEAVITDRLTMRSVTIDAEQRASLLHVLAIHTRAAGEDFASADVVARGVWGKRAQPGDNSLHVLVHRLRREIEGAGFEPWMLDTSRRRMIRLVGVEVANG